MLEGATAYICISKAFVDQKFLSLKIWNHKFVQLDFSVGDILILDDITSRCDITSAKS